MGLGDHSLLDRLRTLSSIHFIRLSSALCLLGPFPVAFGYDDLEASLAGLAVDDADRSAVRFDHLLNDRQPQAGARRSARTTVIEHVIAFLGGDPRPVVRDEEIRFGVERPDR